MSFAMKKIFGAKEKTPLGFCDAPQMTVSEFFFGENPNYPKYHTTYRPLGHIHRVAAEGDAAQMEILIMLGQCSVYDRDRKDRTALHFACVYGRLPVVTVLLNNKCEIDALDKNHTTPLMKSVQCWKQKCATVLLEHGADPNIIDHSGNSALHYAVYNGHEEMAALLLQYNADIEQKTKDGFTPLLLALREKRLEVAEFLVKMGADIHVVDELQRNALIYAIRCGSKDLAILLLENGIDFSYKDVFGWTALRYAIEGHCTFRQTLLDFEENLYINKKGNEPEVEVEPKTSYILAEQIDAGNESLAKISSCPSPETPVLAMKGEENSCDTRSNSESKPPNCADNSPTAVDKIFGNRGKRTVEAWVEKDPSSKSATEVRDSVTNETVERIELLTSVSETELELMSVEENVSGESGKNQPLIKVGHLSGVGYQVGKTNVNGQMKESDKEYAQLMTPVEMINPVSKEPWATKNASTFKSEPDVEVTLKEDHSRFDDRRNIQSLRIREDLPNTSHNVSVAANPRRERTNRQAAESAKEYPPLMPTNEIKNFLDKVVSMKEAGIVQFEGTAVNLTPEEEPSSQDGLERNPPSNIYKQIPAQDVSYLSIAKYQRGEKMASQEKEFSKECPQSKPTIIKEESVSKEGWDMSPVKSFLEDTPKDYLLSKSTVEKNDYTPNEVSDTKHGKWFQENCSKECVQLKLPIKERDSFPREAPPVKQTKSHCADEPAFVKNSSRITRCIRQNESSVKVTSEDDQKCPYGHEKNQRVQAVFKGPQPKDIGYLSMDNDESRENSAESQEEDCPEQLQWKSVQPSTEEDSSPNKVSATKTVKSFLTAEPTTNVSKGEQEWCDSRNMQRQGIGNLFLVEDQRYDSSIQDEEEDFPEGYVQLKPLDKEKTPIPCEAPAKKEVKTFGTELDENLSSEEEQLWLDYSEEEHSEVENPHAVWLEHVSSEPQPRSIVQLPMPKDERGGNVIIAQEKGFPTEYPELKASIEKQDFVSTENSTRNQEKSLLAGTKTEQLWSAEEQTGWRGSHKKQWKVIFERLQLKRNARVSIDSPKIVKNTRAAEYRGAMTIQQRPEEDQTGWYAIEKQQQKPVFEQLPWRCSAQTSVDPEESGDNTGATPEKGATTIQLKPEEDQTGWYAIEKKQQKPIVERFQPRWNTRVSFNPEESGENMRVAEEKGATTVQLRPEMNQMGRDGSDKIQWKPILERLQLKWSARVSVGPEKSRRHREAGEGKVEQLSSAERTGCHSSVKKPRLNILEQLQRKWSVRVCTKTNQRGGKTKAAPMAYSPDEYPELKPTQTTTEKQDSVPVEDPVMNHEISFMAESNLQVKSKEKKQTQTYENIQSVHVFKHLQPKGIGHLSMTAGQRSKSSREEEAEPHLNMASGVEQNRFYSSESSQSLVEAKTKNHESNRTDRAEYPSDAAAADGGGFPAAAGAAAGGGVPAGAGAAAAGGGGGGAAAAAGAEAAVGAAAVGPAAASGMNELVLQRKSGEINNQGILIKENAKHDRPRKKTSKEKHKVTKEVRAMVDVTPLSESVSEDDSGSSFKRQDSLNSHNTSIDLKKVNELLRKRNKKLENEKNALKKEISAAREEKSKLEDEMVQEDEEFWNLRFMLRKELEETRNIHCIYEMMKKHLSEKEKLHRERAAAAQYMTHLMTQDLELQNTRDTLKELQEAQDQHIGTIKIAQKTKDDLQRVEHENSELKVKVKEQAKEIEKLSRYLQNSRERGKQSSKQTHARVGETLEVSCKNNISPVNQIGIRTQSLPSEPSQSKPVQDPNTSSLKSYEQQCIEELRINNALLYERYNLHRNRRLEESRTKVHITVEQGTSPLNTSETRFSLESPRVACTCPHQYFFPHEAVALPGNPRSSNYSQSYRRTIEDDDKSVKELTELKQSLECKLCHQKRKNDEIEKEIIGIKKFLKMKKIGHKTGDCSSRGHSRTGQF